MNFDNKKFYEKKWTLILILLLIFPLFSIGQEENSNVITLQLLQTKNWKELVSKGKKYLKEDGDFYFLQYRVGIGYFNLKNYQSASHFFENAYAKDPSDSILIEYLYLSYLYSGNYEKAELVKSKLTFEQKKNLDVKESVARNVLLYTGVLQTKNIDESNNYITSSSPNKSYTGIVNGGNKSIGVFVGLQPSKKVSLDIGATTFINESRAIHGRGTPIDITNVNSQANIFLKYYLGKNINIGMGGGIYLSNIPYFGIKASVPPPAIIMDSSYAANFYSMSFFTSYRIGNFVPSVLLSYTNLNIQKNLQSDFALLWYPFGNINLYAQTNFGIVPKEFSNNQFYYIYTQKIGGKLIGKLWSEINFSKGTMNNYITNYNFTSFNTYDLNNLMAGIDFSYHLQKISFTLGYQYQQRGKSIGLFSPVQPSFSGSESSNYSLNNYKFLIKWNF